jgi:chromosome segregation protein
MKPRLKALELHGYKTFASRVQFEFPGNITAIVGPNGSGKSNIADALRWVLGEQSFSLLRGKKTDDMIFLGSDQRPRAGMASAAITFDNEDGWLPIDYTDVSVARRAYRDGNNEYLLNRQRVRLKDISELLAQSGLAERTYTIIGQGLVDAALSLRPEERRKFFEEAAGIGLFRSRREESLNRLDATQRNFERVQDIIGELEPRLKSLERQAKKAEEFDHARDDLHVLLKDWYGFHWQNTQKDLVRAREILKNLDGKVRTTQEKRTQIEFEVHTVRSRLNELRDQLNGWHSKSAGLHTGREKVSRDLAVLDERYRSLRDQESALKNDLVISEEQSILHTERFDLLKEELIRLRFDLEESKGQLSNAQNQLQTRQVEREKIEEQLRTERKNLTETESKQVQQKAHQRELTSRLENQLDTQIHLLNDVQNNSAIFTSLTSQKDQATSEMEQAQLDLAKIEQLVVDQAEDITIKEEEKRTLTHESDRLNTEMSRLKAQLDVLDQAEKSLTGLTEGAKNLLKASKEGRLKGQFKAISGLLQVPAELEIAIGSVLGDQLDAVLLDASSDPEFALAFLDNEENGRAILIPSSLVNNFEKLKNIKNPGVIGIAADLVEGNAEIKSILPLLLGQVIIVNDRNTAKKLMSSIPSNARIVTLKGEVFLGTGVIIAGRDKRASLVSRPRQRRELIEKTDECEKRLRSQECIVSIIKDKIESFRLSRHDKENDFKKMRFEFDTKTRTYQAVLRNFEQQNQKNEWQQSQLSLINDEIVKTNKELEALESQIKSGSEKINTFNSLLHDLNNSLRSVSLEDHQSQVVHWSTSFAVTSRGVAEAERRQLEFEQTVKQNKTLGENVSERLKTISIQIKGVDSEKQTLHEQEKEFNASITELQEQIDPAEKELLTLDSEYSKLMEEYTIAQQNESNAERASSQSQLELSRTRENLESLRRKIEEDFGLVTLEYSEDVTGPTPLPLEGIGQLTTITEIPQGLEESINRQRAIMRRMGAINPDAKIEYYEVKERYEYLTSQLADLRKADADLRQIINELDDLMRKEFRTTFNAVAAEFKVMFTRLFGGGSARLMLTDDENPTETGIDIEAKLPGRKEQGLSLLSGGERSLTAVALIFSLLKVSPTPFCVLDEVDAMLDEANVGRFTELLKELSNETQFIVITHNRNTVQVADVIYGITMGRDSASQVISLRLDEVDNEILK